ncbi:MAG: flagellar basal body rod C-terminal domain-containing protein [Desulfovibrionaceae bacterium]
MSDSSIQALSALSEAMQVTANNVANVSTPEFQASRARFEDGPGGQGVRISHLDVDHSPGPYQLETMPGGLEYVEGSNVDIGREMVDLILTENAFSANAVMVREWDRTMGLVVDLKV